MAGMEANTEPNMTLARLIRSARQDLGMKQTDLAVAADRSRHWVTQLEKGVWYKSGERFTLDGDNALRLALVLNLDPVKGLRAGEVPLERWPDLSKIRSHNASVRVVDISSLTVQQQNLIERLVDELKHPTSREN